MILSKIKPVGVSIILAAVLAGCSKLSNPLDQEQYKKTVYIVGANQSNNQGLMTVNLPYTQGSDDTTSTYISAATGGSLVIDQPLTVNVAEAGLATVNLYNSMYLYKPTDVKYQALATANYIIPDYNIQIKSGQTYGNMPIQVKTANLQCDSLYALTFRINAVSVPNYAEIRKTDSVLIFSFKLYNAYSASYQETGRYYKFGLTVADTVALALTRTFTAVNYNTLRFYHLTNVELATNVKASGVTVKINSDNTLTLAPWGTLVISAGTGTYDPIKKQLNISYNYVDAGITYTFKGTFIRAS